MLVSNVLTVAERDLIVSPYYDGDEYSGSVIKKFPHQLSKFLQLKQRPGSHRYAVTFDQSLGTNVISALTRPIVTHQYVFTSVNFMECQMACL